MKVVTTTLPAGESARATLGGRNRSLDMFFSPSDVAVVGASDTPGSVDRALLSNLTADPFGGVVFPVNPKRQSVLGLQAYPSVAALPTRVQLAVVATPAATVPSVIRECVDAGSP